MKNIDVIIIGASHHNTLGVIRCFGEQGLKPILILYGSKDSYILKSKYIKEFYVVESAFSSLDLLINQSVEWKNSVLISCTDDIASILDLNYDKLISNYQFFNCGRAGLLTSFMNKYVQSSIAKEVGMEIPDSCEGFKNDVYKCYISYPRIIKPLESIHGGKHIVVCEDEEAYSRGIAQFQENERIIVQQFIQKDYEIVVLGLSYRGSVFIPGFIHKYRDYDGGTTYSSVKSKDAIPESLLKSCENLVKKMGYEGLFGIELLNRADKYYFVEMNLRNDATTYSMHVAGANLPYMYYNLCTVNSNTFIDFRINEIFSIVDLVDLKSIRLGKVNIIQWIKEWCLSKCHYQCSFKDIWPFVYFIVFSILRKFRKK